MELGYPLIKAESEEEMSSDDFDGNETETDVSADGNKMLMEDDALKSRHENIKMEDEHEHKGGILENEQVLHSDSWLKKWTEPGEDVKNIELQRTTTKNPHESFGESEKPNRSNDISMQEQAGIKNQEINWKHKMVKKKGITKNPNKIKEKITKSLNRPVIATFIDDASLTEAPPYRMCTFKCLHCPVQLESWRTFSLHLNIVHQKKALIMILQNT